MDIIVRVDSQLFLTLHWFSYITIIVIITIKKKDENILRFLKKRFTVTLLLLVLTSCWLSGCLSKSASTAEQVTKDDGQVVIVTSFYPMYIMAMNIAKDIPDVKIINLANPQTGCLHDYQLSPDNVITLEKADIFIINGAGMESFIDKVVQQQPDLKVIEASRGIPLIKGAGNQGDNPHVWVSVKYAIQEVKNIEKQLTEADSKHAAQYQSNTINYVNKLENLHKNMHQELAGISNRNIVTFHEAFPYFAKEFNLKIVAVVEREPGSEPSASDLADIIAKVKASHAKAVFAEPQYSSSAAETIARETGIKVYSLDPAVSGPNSPDAYINIMKTNLESLKEALN
jgi:zinc transport system substrate-binding protein